MTLSIMNSGVISSVTYANCIFYIVMLSVIIVTFIMQSVIVPVSNMNIL